MMNSVQQPAIGSPSVTTAVKPSPLTFLEIETFAETIAAGHGFAPETDSVTEFAEKLGGRVAYVYENALEHLQGGSVEIEGPGRFFIKLSPITGMLRNNFTIAHELGHYFLHSGKPHGSVPITMGRWGTGLTEQQANRFAAGLLMPRERFLEAADRTEDDARILGGWFNVSPTAAEIRLKSLNRIGS